MLIKSPLDNLRSKTTAKLNETAERISPKVTIRMYSITCLSLGFTQSVYIAYDLIRYNTIP